MQILNKKKSNKIDNIRKRIIYFADNVAVSRAEFLSKTKLKKGIFDPKDLHRAIGSDKISNILESYPQINTSWLLTGEGEMIQSVEDNKNIVTTYSMRTDNLDSNQVIPLYNIEASAGLVELFRNQNDEKAIDTISIPNLPKCDGAIYVTGDSMYPLLKSGDIIMYKEIHNVQDGLFWGEMYLISLDMDGEEFVTVKYIQKSEKGDQHVKLVSQNPHHQPREVELKRIRALALVKASIRINSMN